MTEGNEDLKLKLMHRHKSQMSHLGKYNVRHGIHLEHRGEGRAMEDVPRITDRQALVHKSSLMSWESLQCLQNTLASH